MELIAARPNMVEVIFVPMDNADLKEQETLWIQEHIPCSMNQKIRDIKH